MTVEMDPARWGDPAAAAPLPQPARELVRMAFGDARTPAEPTADAPVAAPALDAALLAGLRGIVGDEHVITDDDLRRRRTRGKSTPDLLRNRAGDFAAAPD